MTMAVIKFKAVRGQKSSLPVEQYLGNKRDPVMSRVLILSATLILGLIGAVNGFAFGPTERPKYPVTADLGCKPGGLSVTMCPVRQDCFADKQFKNGGRCDCNPLFWKYQKSLPFNPDSEWDDGFTTEDCQDDHFSRFLSNVFYGMNMAMCLAFIYTDGVVLRELVRAKALKWNATAYSLVAMFIYATSMFFISMIYFLNNWDRDVIEFWYNSRALLFVYLKAPFEVIVDFEICLTWIDLYDRTQKMTKNSSRALNVLRWSMRLIAVGVAIASYYMTRFGGIVGLLTTNMFSPILGGIFTLIGGNLIIKVLCPNKKDVANPNWIIASSIRRAVNNGIICSFFLVFGLGGMTLTVRHPLYGHSYGWFCTCYFCMTVVRIWNWLQYIICGSRKHLKKFSTEQSSSYFGFSTIGLNKTLTNVSSRLSSAAKSSVLSSKSSAAFTGKSEAGVSA